MIRKRMTRRADYLVYEDSFDAENRPLNWEDIMNGINYHIEKVVPVVIEGGQEEEEMYLEKVREIWDRYWTDGLSNVPVAVYKDILERKHWFLIYSDDETGKREEETLTERIGDVGRERAISHALVAWEEMSKAEKERTKFFQIAYGKIEYDDGYYFDQNILDMNTVEETIDILAMIHNMA